MKSFAKKFLSIALAAVLLLGVLPMAAFAAEQQYTVFIYEEAYTGNQADAVASFKVDNGTKVTFDMVKSHLPALPLGKEVASITWGNNDAVDGSEETSLINGSDRNVVFHTTDVTPVNIYLYKNKYTGNPADIVASFQINPGTVVTKEMANSHAPSYTNEVLQTSATAFADGSALGVAVEWDRNVVLIYKSNAPLAAFHDVILEGTNVKVSVKEGAKITQDQINTLKAGVEVPTGKKLESLRAANNEVLDTDTVINADLVVTPYFVDDPSYNPRPDGADWYYTIHMDEGWTHGAKYDAPKQIQQNQRFGIVFKNDKNVNGTLPVPSRNLHVFRGWYVVDEEGFMTNKKVDAETIFDEGRHVTLRAKWEREAEVYLRIYRNGNTTTPYTIQPLYGYAEGETIYTKDLKIGDFYKNGGKPFDFDGWYDRGGWTLYKAKDNPHPISSIKASEVGGQTILYCMITDSNAPSNKTPDHTNPKTGDESMIIATTAVMLVSAGALAVFFMDRKRRNG